MRWGCQCGIEWLEDENIDTDEAAYQANIRKVSPTFVTKAENLFEEVKAGKHAKSKALAFQTVKGKEVAQLRRISGLNLKGAKHTITPSGVRHAYKQHGQNLAAEKKRGQALLTKKDIALIPRIVRGYDRLTLSKQVTVKQRLKVLVYEKKIGNKKYFYLEAITKTKPPKLITQLMYIKK